MERGAGWVRRPVRPVGLPASRYWAEDLRMARSLVVGFIFFCGWL